MKAWRPGMSKALMMPCIDAQRQNLANRDVTGERERGQRERLHHGERLRPHQHLAAVEPVHPERRRRAQGERWESGPAKLTVPSSSADLVSR